MIRQEDVHIVIGNFSARNRLAIRLKMLNLRVNAAYINLLRWVCDSLSRAVVLLEPSDLDWKVSADTMQTRSAILSLPWISLP